SLSLITVEPAPADLDRPAGEARSQQVELVVRRTAGQQRVAGADADAGSNGSYDSGFSEQASALVGEEVTVSATVNEVVDPNSFSITGIEETSAEPLLVVGSDIAGVLEEELGLDLTDDGYTDFAGREYIVAESVDIQVPAEQE
uniref:hypothetical protein n=1 Tax=Modestobacter sp. KNN46-3 TaxID=2711218 RepID=UPI0019D2DAA8